MQGEVLAELEKKLDYFHGLTEVKLKMHAWINLLQIQKNEISKNLHDSSIPLHLVFVGEFRTGKTRTAELLAKTYAELDLLSMGELIKLNASDLTEESILQQANQALGNVWLITHVHTMSEPVFLKLLDILQWENFAVILSGSELEIEKLFYQFPVLRLKFANYFYFKDIQPEYLNLQKLESSSDKTATSYLVSEQEQISETEFAILKSKSQTLALDSKEGDFLLSGNRMDLTPYIHNEIKIRLAYQKLMRRMELDTYLFMLNQNEPVILENMLFFGNISSENGAVSVIEHAVYPECVFRLHKIEEKVQKIAICFSIYGNQKSLNFSKIEKPVLQIFQGNTQLAYLDLSNLQKRSVMALELYRYKNSWKLHALANDYDSLEQLCEEFGIAF